MNHIVQFVDRPMCVGEDMHFGAAGMTHVRRPRESHRDGHRHVLYRVPAPTHFRSAGGFLRTASTHELLDEHVYRNAGGVPFDGDDDGVGELCQTLTHRLLSYCGSSATDNN
jgi:hypothetical protein